MFKDKRRATIWTRVPHELRNALIMRSREDDVPLSEVVAILLAEGIGRPELGTPMRYRAGRKAMPWKGKRAKLFMESKP